MIKKCGDEQLTVNYLTIIYTVYIYIYIYINQMLAESMIKKILHTREANDDGPILSCYPC